MFLHKTPKLESGAVKKEMLHTMRDLPLKYMESLYVNHPNGIISGCELFERGHRIGVNPGIIKYSGRLYFLEEEDAVEYRSTDSWTVLKIQFAPRYPHPEYEWYEGKLVLDQNINVLPNEIELGRFKLKVGSHLRTEYESFMDMYTEYDTLILIDVPYSLPKASTLHPEILLHFVREVYPLVTDSMVDLSFCSTVLGSSGIVSRELISSYVSVKLNYKRERWSNGDLFNGLDEIIRTLQGRGKREEQETEGIYLL